MRILKPYTRWMGIKWGAKLWITSMPWRLLLRFGGIEMAATIQQLLCNQAFNIFQGRLPLARFNACVMHVHFTIMSAQINYKGLSSRNIISCTLHLICMNAENLHGHDTLTWTHEITQTTWIQRPLDKLLGECLCCRCMHLSLSWPSRDVVVWVGGKRWAHNRGAWGNGCQSYIVPWRSRF